MKNISHHLMTPIRDFRHLTLHHLAKLFRLQIKINGIPYGADAPAGLKLFRKNDGAASPTNDGDVVANRMARPEGPYHPSGIMEAVGRKSDLPKADADSKELRVRARLAWNNWPDNDLSRKTIAEHEARDAFSAHAWDRVVASVRGIACE